MCQKVHSLDVDEDDFDQIDGDDDDDDYDDHDGGDDDHDHDCITGVNDQKDELFPTKGYICPSRILLRGTFMLRNLILASVGVGVEIRKVQRRAQRIALQCVEGLVLQCMGGSVGRPGWWASRLA